MKTARLVIKVSPEYQDNIKKQAKSENLSTSDYIRKCLDQGGTEGVTNEHTKVDQSVSVIIDELAVKNEQINKLQEALDQSQQLQAMKVLLEKINNQLKQRVGLHLFLRHCAKSLVLVEAICFFCE